MPDSNFFRTDKTFTLQELAIACGAKLSRVEDAEIKISAVAALAEAKSGQITFLSNPKYQDALQETLASACFISQKYALRAPSTLALLVTEEPYLAYAKAASLLHPEPDFIAGIHPAAIIDPSAKCSALACIEAGAIILADAIIGDETVIGAGAVIGSAVKIGSNCRIGARSSLSHCIIGDRVIIHPGVAIGQDGFGFAYAQGVHHKVPQLGRVIVESDVEIGANSCIDRGAGPDTVIGEGTKIDNLVQIGHNVRLGKGCVIVAQVGISGSTVVEDYAVLGGQVGVAGHLTIGKGANIAAQSGVMRNVAAGEVQGGSPACSIRQWHKQQAVLRKLSSAAPDISANDSSDK